MNYPFWDVPISYGFLMGAIAVLHVFISHFAIGGGLYLVVTEWRARKRDDQPMLAFLKRLSRFFILVTLVTGTLTGVAIWFIIGLLNPGATEALIHYYVWGWATEWTFFAVEIASALIYYYGWERMSAAAHLAVGWIYFIFAWLSLVIINGIITFMLTPGRWLESGSFWDGFFNPTYWPSLVMRTGICTMLAGLYALFVVSRDESGDFKARTIRYSAVWGFLGLIVIAPAQFWYWQAIPTEITTRTEATMRIPMQALRFEIWFAAAIAILLVLAWVSARRVPVMVAVLLMVLGFGWFGSFEMFRESIRKPYVITGYMYGNGMEVAKAETYKSGGYLAQIAYPTGDEPTDLFLHSCRSCHTLTGYRPLAPAFAGTDAAFIAATVRGVHLLRAKMPPFLGTPEEARKLADYIYQRVDHRPLAEICKAEGADLGRRAYAVRCGKCHVVGTSSDKSETFAGLSSGDVNDLLDMAGDLAEGMPAYTGPEEERTALTAYLQSLGKQVKK